MSLDLVLRGGTVVDGTGRPGQQADVAVVAGRIIEVGRLTGALADTVLDVDGLIVAPGLIDAHVHSDWTPYLPEDCTDIQLANVRQGVTTEVSGNCGMSPFPWIASAEEPAPAWNGLPLFASLAAYRTALADRSLVINLAPLLGHNRVRASVMGMVNRLATSDEIDSMARLVAAAMEDGAFGISTGLVYSPGNYAGTDELVALAAVVSRYQRIYATHMRNESDAVVEAMNEALHIGRAGGLPVQISHHKLSGAPNWGRSQETLALLTAARRDGEDVTIDVYPYTASSSFLGAVLPTWVAEGGLTSLQDRLRDPATRRRVYADLLALPEDNVRRALAATDWRSVVVAGAPSMSEVEGLSIPDIAERQGCAPFDAVCSLLLGADEPVMMVSHTMSQEDVDAIGQQSFAMGGSDGVPFPGKQHPRGAGTFARWLAAAAADPTQLPDRVHRVTGLTAARFRIPNRGTVEVGRTADLCVFDPVTVQDQATYQDHLAAPRGITHVVLTGQLVIRNGADTGRRCGRVLEPR